MTAHKTSGVIYMVTSGSHVEAARVSICSLRRYYGGPITMLAASSTRPIFTETLSNFKVDVAPIPDGGTFPNSVRYHKYHHCLMKTFANILTPYDHTVFLDADTVIRGPIGPLFDCEIGLVGYERLMDDILYAKRRRYHVRKLRRHNRVWAPMVDATIRMNPPWPNTGVYSFPQGHPLIREWFYLAQAIAGRRVHDEVPLALVLPDWRDSITWFDRQWNAVRYMAEWGQAIIRHHVDNTWDQDEEWLGLREQCQ